MIVSLHIGTHKTGTTSIQSSLYETRTYLKGLGYLYPDAGLERDYHGAYGHHQLSRSFIKGSHSEAAKIIRKLMKEFRASGCHSIIISAEGLYTISAPAVAYLAELFGEADVCVFVYLRRPQSYLASLYKSKLRKGEKRSPFEFYPEVWRDMRYDDRINVWQAEFGATSVKAISYARLLTLNRALVDPLVPSGTKLSTTELRINPSMPVGVANAALLLNKMSDAMRNHKVATQRNRWRRAVKRNLPHAYPFIMQGLGSLSSMMYGSVDILPDGWAGPDDEILRFNEWLRSFPESLYDDIHI